MSTDSYESDVAQNLVGVLHYRCIFLAHGKLLVNQHFQILLLWATINWFSAQPVFVLGVAFRVPLYAPLRLVVLGSLLRVCSIPLSMLPTKMLNGTWSWYWPLRNAACHHSLFEHWTLDHNFPSIHPCNSLSTEWSSHKIHISPV